MKKLIVLILILQIQKFYAQNLNFEWVRTAGNIASDVSQSVITDNAGDVISTGYFEKTIAFKSINKNITLTANGNSGYYDMFVVKTTNGGSIKWAKNIGGKNAGIASYKMVVDTFKNIYISGIFTGKVDFDPNVGVFELTTSGINSDIFLMKMDSIGNFIWAKSMGSSDYDYCTSMTIDKSHSNVYIVGNFGGAVDFNPSNAIDMKYSFGQNDGFISKFDVNGNYVWTQTFGGKTFDFISDISINLNNEIFVTGNISDTVYFENKQHKLYAKNLGTFGFIAKYNSDGKYVWSQKIGDGACHGVSISNDYGGNIYVEGYFYSFVDFNFKGTPNYKSSKGGADIFILKLTTNGDFIWVKTFEGNLEESAREMYVSPSGNIYSCTIFQTTYSSNIVHNIVDFDPSSSNYYLTNKGPSCAVISKLDSSGKFKWAKLLGGDNSVVDPTGITQDLTGNIFTCGAFQSIVDFNPDLPVLEDTTKGSYDIFIHKLGQCENSFKTINLAICAGQQFIFNGQTLKKSGQYIDTFVSRYGCDSVVQLNLIVNKPNTIFKLNDTLYANQVADSYQWYHCDSNKIIIGATTNKLHPLTKGNYKLITSKNGCDDTTTCYSFFNNYNFPYVVFPNPTTGQLTVRFGEKLPKIKYKVYDAIARLIIEDIQINASEIELNCEVYCNGVYFIKVEIDDTIYNIKFLKL